MMLQRLSTIIALLALLLLCSACSSRRSTTPVPATSQVAKSELPAIDFRRPSQQLAKNGHTAGGPAPKERIRFDSTKPISVEEWRKLGTATPEELNGALKEAGSQWLYGPGLGQTATNVGTVVVFPPYALYLLGNAGLSLAGFEQLYITKLLPQAPRKHVLDFYDGITSVPGRLSALVAGKEYYQPEPR